MTSRIELQLGGMGCEKCEERVSAAVGQLTGVRRATADHRTGEVRVLVEGEVGRDDVVARVTEAGYEVDR